MHTLSRRRSLAIALLVNLALQPPAASAAGTAPARSPGAHEHGSATLGIAVDGQSVTFELDGPASNFVGFEHRPANPEQTAALAHTLNVLRNGAALFLMPPGAQCRLQSAAVSPPAYAADGHANLEAFWEFRCGSPAALAWVEARLFTAFPATEKVATSVVTPAGEKAVVLTPGTTRVLLPR
ncbi:MAG: DUF2796 domain-containing protein [Gammaproteobacteria bacterium]